MKRRQFIAVLGATVSLDAFALGAAVSPATAQTQQQIDWCINATHEYSLDQQVSGCTVAIQSGRWRGKGLVWAFQDRGLAYYDKRDYDHAIADYDQAIKLDPKNANAFKFRGLAYYRKQDYFHAIADFDEAIRIEPGNAEAFYQRGTAYVQKKDYGRAITDYNVAIKLDPKYAFAFNNRGDAYRAEGDYDPPLTITRRPSGSILNMPLLSTIEAMRIMLRATTTAPLPIIARRSSSTPKTHTPTTIAVSYIATRRTTIAPLAITRRRSGSIPSLL